MKKVIHIHSKDNVVVALKDLKKADTIVIDDIQITLVQDVPRGHKIAIELIKKNENVIKYGFPIGHAKEDIAQGEYVHTHNVKTNLSGVFEYSYKPNRHSLETKIDFLTFQGYKRKNGSVGIRNELWSVPTVGCVNGIAEKIAKLFMQKVQPKNIDDVQVWNHNYGCSQLGKDHENTRTILADIVQHPNAGGVLVRGLGCENNTLEIFREKLGEYDEERIVFLEAQKVQDEIMEGVNLLKKVYEKMKTDKQRG